MVKNDLLRSCSVRSCSLALKASHILLSQSVQEIGPLIAKLVNLLPRLTFNPVVALASSALRILATEEKVLQNTASEQEHSFVSQHDGVARLESRLVLGAVDI